MADWGGAFPTNLDQYSPSSGGYNQMMADVGKSNNSAFWDDWMQSVMSGSTQGGTGGVGSTIGGIGGSAIGTAVAGPLGGMIGGQLGSMGGDLIEGGITGGDSEADKLAREQKQTEQIQRTWDINNRLPTGGVANWQARNYMLYNNPVLFGLNQLDFWVNKVMPYIGENFGPQGKQFVKGVNKAYTNFTNLLAKPNNKQR